jgi:putative selenium metabolism hydrolase
MPELTLPSAAKEFEPDLIRFAQELVRIKSLSGSEGELAKRIEAEMIKLSYDEVFIDSIGNVVGRVGGAGKLIMFDSHMDTVDVREGEEWIEPPFSGNIVDGKLYGRGSSDMKCALASSVYAAAIAKKLGYGEGKTVYVTCTVNEEDCDGENLKSLFKEKNLRPDYFVTCEPSCNEIVLGHNGKAQVLIKTKGVSAHGSRPQDGVNAVYKMADIIARVEKLNEKLSRSDEKKGTVALTYIACETVSYNAVPSECSIYLDRRLLAGETIEDVRAEMDDLIAGADASWEIGTIRGTSWTGVDIEYRPVHEAWRIGEGHELTRACLAAYEEVFGKKHGPYHTWAFGTNAVTPVGAGIPTIGFGPGNDRLAHMADEHCLVGDMIAACQFYASLIRMI